MVNFIILCTVICIAIYYIFFIYNSKTKHWQLPNREFPNKWKLLLSKHVAYYNTLSVEEKELFEFKVDEFLLNCRITGIQSEIDEVDQLMVASSAIIPIFKFPNWKYLNLDEVLIYPSSFNHDFETDGPNRNILGMVGSGYMEGKMILSRQALRLGFDNSSDKRNTAIHEFVHLIDKMDGTIDGVPSLLLERPYVIPWLSMIQHKIEDIYDQKSDINPYATTNNAEFFSVISEYFFERPKLLSIKHPELYKILEEIFDQDMSSKNLVRNKQSKIGRNNPCPCGSSQKFKKCCGKNHY